MAMSADTILTTAEAVVATLEAAMDAVEGAKPGDRSWVDRRFAVLLTDIEKAVAYARDMAYRIRESDYEA